MTEGGSKKGIALITGADGGMGRIHTRALAKEGYDVVMACYDTEVARPVRDAICKETGSNIHLMQVDLADLQSVVRFCDDFKSQFPTLNILLNNAGVLSSKCKTSANNVEYTVAVNYLGHYTLTNLLRPVMVNGTRIVSMISIAYYLGRIKPDFFTPKTPRKYNRFFSYGNSKLALYYFMLDASEAWENDGITFNVADPDIVSTNIIRLDNAVADKLCDWFFRPFINTPEQGAASMIAAALNPEFATTTGKIIKKCKIAEHNRKFYDNVAARTLLRDMTQELLHKNNITL